MSGIFTSPYARCYDALYGGLDYDSHFSDAMWLLGLGPAAPGAGSNILDIGCGTGEFAVRAVRAGHSVAGIDPSRAMLDIAEAKCSGAGVASFSQGTAATFKVVVMDNKTGKFDAAMMMGGVLGYQGGNAECLAALGNVRQHLKPGSKIVLDVWNACAVLSQGVGERIKSVVLPDGRRAVRAARGRLDHARSTCMVEYTLYIEGQSGSIEEAGEWHYMRYFLPTELELLLTSSGFKMESIAALGRNGKATTPDDWHMVASATAC